MGQPRFDVGTRKYAAADPDPGGGRGGSPPTTSFYFQTVPSRAADPPPPGWPEKFGTKHQNWPKWCCFFFERFWRLHLQILAENTSARFGLCLPVSGYPPSRHDWIPPLKGWGGEGSSQQATFQPAPGCSRRALSGSPWQQLLQKWPGNVSFGNGPSAGRHFLKISPSQLLRSRP